MKSSEYTLGCCIMPPHCRTYYGDEQSHEEHFRGTKSTGILHDSGQDSNKCCSEAQCGINPDVEEWVFSGARQLDGRRIQRLQTVDSMREMVGAKQSVHHNDFLLNCMRRRHKCMCHGYSAFSIGLAPVLRAINQSFEQTHATTYIP